MQARILKSPYWLFFFSFLFLFSCFLFFTSTSNTAPLPRAGSHSQKSLLIVPFHGTTTRALTFLFFFSFSFFLFSCSHFKSPYWSCLSMVQLLGHWVFRMSASRTNSQTHSIIVASYSRCTRLLTFQNFCQPLGILWPPPLSLLRLRRLLLLWRRVG